MDIPGQCYLHGMTAPLKTLSCLLLYFNIFQMIKLHYIINKKSNNIDLSQYSIIVYFYFLFARNAGPCLVCVYGNTIE